MKGHKMKIAIGIVTYKTPKEDTQRWISSLKSSLLDVKDTNKIEIEIFTIGGRKTLTSTNTTINISHLPSGLYLAKITTPNGRTAFKKIIKNQDYLCLGT